MDEVAPPLRVLIVDSDRADADSVAENLRAEGHRCEVVTSGVEGLTRIREAQDGGDAEAETGAGARGDGRGAGDAIDLVIVGLELADGFDAFEILREARERRPPLEVVVVTAHSSVEAAVEAMNRGALTYLAKPLNFAELRAVVRRADDLVRLERTNVALKRQLEEKYGFEAIIGGSPRMQRVFEVLTQVARTNATVLILGESGTGKELIAKTIHQNSPRRNAPFVGLNCAALSESILESELFGHEKGSFTGATQTRRGRFEYANHGTLFLDEVGDMPIPTQIKLLRVLEEREIVRVGSNVPIRVDVRLLGATNQDLEEAVKRGAFRQDLYFRLKVVTIAIPPLRERAADIPLLIESFLAEFAREHGKPVTGIAAEARRLLMAYPFPGNVRELKNAIEQMVVVAKGPVLTADDVPPEVLARKHEPRAVEGLAGMSLEDVERELIQSTLDLTQGNREEAARMLGIGERTLYRKIKKYGLK